jgi:hypothetical protein
MKPTQDQILARELGKVGALGGAIGGLAPGAAGGYLGSSIAARFLPTETFSTTRQIRKKPDDAVRTVFEVLSSIGRITDEFTDELAAPRLSAVVGSGFLKMNPAIVHVHVAPREDGTVDITTTAAAKEGLIKQHTAEKAVTRFFDALSKKEPNPESCVTRSRHTTPVEQAHD